MSYINTRELVDRLGMIESLAVMSTVTSTNLLARRVIDECIENEIPLPSAMVIAREQKQGRGRATRTWHSPFGEGIYSTLLLSRAVSAATVLPLEVAVAVAEFLQETYRIEARIKWPNDILVNRRKIAGILIEARTHDDVIYAAIGIGVNIVAAGGEAVPEATSVMEENAESGASIATATVAFIEMLDKKLAVPPAPDEIIRQWRQSSVHQKGERISSVIGERQISGTWEGIDDSGHALIRTSTGVITVAAGDVILEMPTPVAEE